MQTAVASIWLVLPCAACGGFLLAACGSGGGGSASIVALNDPAQRPCFFSTSVASEILGAQTQHGELGEAAAVPGPGTEPTCSYYTPVGATTQAWLTITSEQPNWNGGPACNVTAALTPGALPLEKETPVRGGCVLVPSSSGAGGQGIMASAYVNGSFFVIEANYQATGGTTDDQERVQQAAFAVASVLDSSS